MVGHGIGFVFAVMLWWLSTGVILLLSTLPRRILPLTLVGGAMLCAVSFYGLFISAREATRFASYVGFLSAIGVWGALELGFLTGYVTGPRTVPCPQDVSLWQRFRFAVSALLYRQFALVVAGLAVLMLTHNQLNQTGALTFLILLVMRISAELNIFLGVPYLPESLLPERLSYLKSYFRSRRFNPLFPVSISGASIAVIFMAQRAIGSDQWDATGYGLMVVLLALAMLEHFFMILPLHDAALWRWAKPAVVGGPVEKPLP